MEAQMINLIMIHKMALEAPPHQRLSIKNRRAAVSMWLAKRKSWLQTIVWAIKAIVKYYQTRSPTEKEAKIGLRMSITREKNPLNGEAQSLTRLAVTQLKLMRLRARKQKSASV